MKHGLEPARLRFAAAVGEPRATSKNLSVRFTAIRIIGVRSARAQGISSDFPAESLFGTPGAGCPRRSAGLRVSPGGVIGFVYNEHRFASHILHIIERISREIRAIRR